MRVQQLAGGLIILGFALVMAASIILGFSYAYAGEQAAQATDADQAIQAISSADPGGWTVSNWLFVLAGLITVVGLALIAMNSRGVLSLAGAALFALGSAFWVIYCYLRIPDSTLSNSLLWMEATFAWLSAGGLLLLGAAFLRGDFPNWVGYVHVGYAVLFVLMFILFGARLYSFFPPQMPYLIALFAGIAAMRSRDRAASLAVNPA